MAVTAPHAEESASPAEGGIQRCERGAGRQLRVAPRTDGGVGACDVLQAAVRLAAAHHSPDAVLSNLQL